MKKWYIIIIAVISILAGYLGEPLVNPFEINSLADLAMDANEETVMLSGDSTEGFELTKISDSGVAKFQNALESASDGRERAYRQLEVDMKGNIYLLLADKGTMDSSSNNSGIIAEKVVMYDTQGQYIKEIANIDFSQQAELSQQPYIYKIQLVDQTVDIICRKDNGYEILRVDAIEDAKPYVKQTLEISPPSGVSAEEAWITDIAVMRSGAVIYADKQGQLFMVDSEKQVQNITSALGGNSTPVNFSIDANDDLFFTEAISGNYYKLAPSNMHLTQLYNGDDIVNAERGIKFGDLKYVQRTEQDTYFGSAKASDKQSFVVFGAKEHVVPALEHSLFPVRLIEMAIIAVVTFAVIFLILFVVLRLRKRFLLKQKIMLLFLPALLVAVILFTGVILYIMANNKAESVAAQQSTSASIVLENMNADLFESVNYLAGYQSEEYKNISEQFNLGVSQARKSVRTQKQDIYAYIMKEDKLYRVLISESPAAGEISYEGTNFKNESLAYAPIDTVLSREQTERYYDIVWKSLSAEGAPSAVCIYMLDSDEGEIINTFCAVKDSGGKLIGFIQVSADKSAGSVAASWLWTLGISAAVLILLTLAALYIVLKIAFRPLNEINRCVASVGEQRWNTKVRISTKDEFADIAMAFNSMTDRMNQYISNLVVLNREYVKFVPTELFHLLGKNKVVDIKLNDKRFVKMNILHVAFNITQNNVGALSEGAYFDVLNRNFDAMFSIVERNRGIIHSFDGTGMIILFPNSPEDAVKASMQFKEVFTGEKLKSRARMMLDTGETVVGVIGNEKRMTIAIIADEIMQMNNINNHMKALSIRHFALQPFIEELGEKGGCNYRLVGQVEDISQKCPVKIYEFIDNRNLYDKNLYIATKKFFETGVNSYIAGDFADARKIFASVLRTNEEDKVALYYMKLCEKNINRAHTDWKGYMFEQ